MNMSYFTRTFLLIFSGPIIWAVHFVAIYGFTGVACARSLHEAEWMGIGAVSWFVCLSGLLALAVIAAIAAGAWNRRPQAEDKTVQAGNASFIRSITIMLAMLAAVAIVWETVPILLVPACA